MKLKILQTLIALLLFCQIAHADSILLTPIGDDGVATSLAANGANCSAGNSFLGVDAFGAVEDCFDVCTQAELTTHEADTTTHGGTVSAYANTAIQTLSVGTAVDCDDATYTMAFIKSGGPGDVNLTVNPQLNGCSAGTKGNLCHVEGTDDIDRIILEDGNGLGLNQSVTLGAGDNVVFKCDGATWISWAGNAITGVVGGGTNSDEWAVDMDNLNFSLTPTNNGTPGDTSDDGFRLENSGNTLLGLYIKFLSVLGDGTIGTKFELGGGDATTEPSWLALREGGTAPFNWFILHPTADGRLKGVRDRDGTLTTPTDTTGDFIPYLHIHATDCTSITTGKSGDQCYEQDADSFYICEPTAGDCDTAAEWRAVVGVLGTTVESSEITDSTIVAGDIASDAITEPKLKAIDTPTDEECFTYESGGGGDFEWQSCGSSDSLSVGIWGYDDSNAAATTAYLHIGNIILGRASAATVANTSQIRSPITGTIRDLYCDVETSHASNTVTYTVRVNDSATSVTCTVAATTLTCNDLTNTGAVTKGDWLQIFESESVAYAKDQVICSFTIVK